MKLCKDQSECKDSRNLFIDFLKGICIICVVITHNLPPIVMKYTVFILWGGMAVPLFLLIQSYHIFNTDKLRKDRGIQSKLYREHYKIGKIWKRIVRPFILVTIMSGVALVIIGHDPLEVIKGSLINGGIGPGSYYVWIYLQFFLLLPLFLTLINKMGGGILTFLLFIIVSQGLEWLCMYLRIQESLYRLLFFRYLFLIYLGYVWVTNKMSMLLSKKQIILSLLSITILIILYYSTGSLNPVLHDSAWRTCHWMCYFYAAFLLPWFLWKFYNKLSIRIKNFISEVGRFSYEIFLLQMMVFTLYPHGLFATGNNFIDTIIFILLSTILSILPVLLWMRWRISKNIALLKNL